MDEGFAMIETDGKVSSPRSCTMTVAVSTSVPTEFVHVIVYVVVTVGVIVCDPDSDFVSDHPIEAEQLVALEELQVRIDVSPVSISIGFATRSTVGGSTCACTVTVVLSFADPAVFVHVILYVVVMVGLTVCEPVIVLVPDQPWDALHDVACVELQVSIELPPFWIDEGLAIIVTVGSRSFGASCTVTVAESIAVPAVFVQVMV